jgi:hypothetical protein
VALLYTVIRNYDAESERQAGVEAFYRQNHIHQTFSFVCSLYPNPHLVMWVCLRDRISSSNAIFL